MVIMKCERCQKENDLTLEECRKFGSELCLQKCPHCQNIKFERTLFIPIEEKVIENYIELQKTEFGPLFRLYLIGSYARNEKECGDIDFLLVWNRKAFHNYIESTIEAFHDTFDSFFLDEDPRIFVNQKIAFTSPSFLAALKETIQESGWDFRTCQEYPDCLACFKGNGNPYCKLPDEDYHATLHTYCLNKCNGKKRVPLPTCCLGEKCIFLEMELRSLFQQKILHLLKKDVTEFFEVNPDWKIKVLEFTGTEALYDFKARFEKDEIRREFIAFRIDPKTGIKMKVTDQELIREKFHHTIEHSLKHCAYAIEHHDIIRALHELKQLHNNIFQSLITISKDNDDILKEELQYYATTLRKIRHLLEKISEDLNQPQE